MDTRNVCLGISIFSLLMCLAFTFDLTGLTWAWRDMKGVPFVLGVISLIFLGQYIRLKREYQ